MKNATHAYVTCMWHISKTFQIFRLDLNSRWHQKSTKYHISQFKKTSVQSKAALLQLSSSTMALEIEIKALEEAIAALVQRQEAGEDVAEELKAKRAELEKMKENPSE